MYLFSRAVRGRRQSRLYSNFTKTKQAPSRMTNGFFPHIPPAKINPSGGYYTVDELTQVWKEEGETGYKRAIIPAIVTIVFLIYYSQKKVQIARLEEQLQEVEARARLAPPINEDTKEIRRLKRKTAEEVLHVVGQTLTEENLCSESDREKLINIVKTKDEYLRITTENKAMES